MALHPTVQVIVVMVLALTRLPAPSHMVDHHKAHPEGSLQVRRAASLQDPKAANLQVLTVASPGSPLAHPSATSLRPSASTAMHTHGSAM